MKNHHWYRVLRKPSWAPSERLFAPVWAVLYLLIAISFGYVGWLFFKHEILPAIAFVFLLNLALNLAFTPILFGFHHLGLASVDVFLTLVTLALCMILIYPFAPWVALVNIPYLLWTAFATVLQFRITALNREERQAEFSFV